MAGTKRRNPRSKRRVPAAPKQHVSDPAWRLPGVSPIVRPWPKGYRSACLFTFDVDCEVTWVFKQSNDPIALSMGQIRTAGRRCRMLLNMLDEFDIKSTFFVPGWVAEKYAPMVEDILKRGHDVEHHGYLHEPPQTFKSEEEEEEALLKGIETLERHDRPPPARLSLADVGVQPEHHPAAGAARFRIHRRSDGYAAARLSRGRWPHDQHDQSAGPLDPG